MATLFHVLEPQQLLPSITPQLLSLQTDSDLVRVTALKQITNKWLNPAAPQIGKWKDTINEIYKMEILELS